MIRINLLPFRAARRKENIRRQVSVFVLLIVLSIVALYYHTLYVEKKISRIKNDISSVKGQITLFKEKADKVTEIRGKLAILEKKLEIVSDLQAKQREPVDLLDKLTKIVVEKRMWLTSMTTGDTSLSLSGIAYDNKTVADFMTRLEDSDLFGEIELKKLEMKKFDDDIQMKSFEVFCKKKVTKAPEPPTKEKPKKKVRK